MNCTDVEKWMHPYVDGELDLPTSLAVEQHIDECAGCKAYHDSLVALGTAVRDPALVYASPTGLEDRLVRSLGLDTGPQAHPGLRPPLPKAEGHLSKRFDFSALRFREGGGVSRGSAIRWFSAGFAVCALLAFAVLHLGRIGTGTTQPVAMVSTQELLDSHLRSLQAGHLEDVISTNQHTVKPWFNGKISFSPPVTNLAAEGYPLVGGRLDYLGSQPAAVLVYKFNKHVINVYVTIPAQSTPSTAIATSTSRGYNIEQWQSGDMAFAAISDINPDGLSRFVALLRERNV